MGRKERRKAEKWGRNRERREGCDPRKFSFLILPAAAGDEMQ